jgi:S1-C subfamily serine protease
LRSLKPVSSGSGFFVSYEGDLITDNHVIAGCRELRVVHGEKSNTARVIGADVAGDLAVLRVPDLAEDVAVFGNRLERPGEAVIVAGYPLQGLLTSKGSVTTGIISALAGPKEDKNLLQITAPIQPGSSGGPLVDAHGAVIGVVASKLNSLRVARATGLLPENINFAVKEKLVRKLLDKIGIKYAVPSSEFKQLAIPEIAENVFKFTAIVQCFR